MKNLNIVWLLLKDKSSSASLLFRLTVTLVLMWVLLSAETGSARVLESELSRNEELIEKLGSVNPDDAAAAATKIFTNGEAMIPLLLKCKGDSRPFYGYGLGDRRSAFLLPLPTGNVKSDQDRVITVEVAALYLISAIYYNSLEFAQAPYLTDGSPVKTQRFNTPKRVSAAWRSVEEWSGRLKREGLESLKRSNNSPLRDSHLHFWGETDVQRKDMLDN